jgi:hypothetical protein
MKNVLSGNSLLGNGRRVRRQFQIQVKRKSLSVEMDGAVSLSFLRFFRRASVIMIMMVMVRAFVGRVQGLVQVGANRGYAKDKNNSR